MKIYTLIIILFLLPSVFSITDSDFCQNYLNINMSTPYATYECSAVLDYLHNKTAVINNITVINNTVNNITSYNYFNFSTSVSGNTSGNYVSRYDFDSKIIEFGQKIRILEEEFISWKEKNLTPSKSLEEIKETYRHQEEMARIGVKNETMQPLSKEEVLDMISKQVSFRTPVSNVTPVYSSPVSAQVINRDYTPLIIGFLVIVIIAGLVFNFIKPKLKYPPQQFQAAPQTPVIINPQSGGIYYAAPKPSDSSQSQQGLPGQIG